MAGFDPITIIFFVWAERAQAEIARNRIKRRILKSPSKKRIVSRGADGLAVCPVREKESACGAGRRQDRPPHENHNLWLSPADTDLTRYGRLGSRHRRRRAIGWRT